MIRRAAILCVVAITAPNSGGESAASRAVVSLPAGPLWQVLSLFSGPDNYYAFLDEGGTGFIRATYRPPMETVILYAKLPSPFGYTELSWRWRMHKLPRGGDEAIGAKNDSGGSVYAYFDTWPRKYVIKYVWSAARPPFFNFRTQDSTLFQKMQLVVLEGPATSLDAWVSEVVDPVADFRRFFEIADDEDVPPLVGIGMLSDGDQTQSEVIADYADFRLRR